MTKIKICGLTSLEEIAYVNDIKPDYIGFVFAESRRKVNKEQAHLLKNVLDKEFKVVGVFVNEPLERVVQLCREGCMDVIQLHGDESREYVALLKEKVSQPVIKVIRVRSREQIIKMSDYPCDYLLLDTYQKGTYGGTGKSLDASLIPDMNRPFILSGGLTEDNVSSMIRRWHPYCVDVSSGVETEGKKDRKKIEAFVAAVRG